MPRKKLELLPEEEAEVRRLLNQSDARLFNACAYLRKRYSTSTVSLTQIYMAVIRVEGKMTSEASARINKEWNGR